MIFLHPNPQFITKPSNPISWRSNCKQKNNPVFVSVNSCSFQEKKGFFQYKYSIKGADCIVKMEYLRKMGIGCFGNSQVKQLQHLGEKVETESVGGGQEVMDSAMVEAKLSPQHLVVMVNGLIGRSFLFLSLSFPFSIVIYFLTFKIAAPVLGLYYSCIPIQPYSFNM